MNAPARLEVTSLAVGPLEANCVIVRAPGRDEALLFDPGDEAPRIFAALDSLGVRPAQIVQTHCHGDHIGAIEAVKARFPDAPLAVPEAERAWLSSPLLNLSQMLATPIHAPDPDRLIADGDEVAAGAVRMRAIHVPGHSPGGTAFYAAAEDGGPVLVAGDILFAGGVGRTDFPGGSFEQLADGIRAKLYTLPDETLVYPGHGPPTTIGEEKRTNPFVRG